MPNDLLTRTDVEPRKRRTPPTFVTVGNRQVTSTGKWNSDLMADFLVAEGRGKWVAIAELARKTYGTGIPRNKEYVRRRLYKLRAVLLARGEIMVTEQDGRRTGSVKLFDPTSQAEQQAVLHTLEQMKKRRELTAEQYDFARCIVQQKINAP